MEININCDLGEKSKHHSNKNDPDLLNIVNSANVACGYHAGDDESMNQVIEISVRLGQIPTNKFSKNNKEISREARDKFGFDVTEFVEDSNSNIGKMVVTRIYPNSIVESVLIKGDIIMEINRQSISNIESFNSIIKKIKPDQNCLFLIQRKSRDGSITFYKSIKSMK